MPSKLSWKATLALLTGMAMVLSFGCCHPSVTAVPLSPWNCGEPEGIPFYLPKPLLIVSKNFRYIEEAQVGLTDSAPIPNFFDDQAKYADLNARMNFTVNDSAGSAGSGGTPHADGGGPVTPPTPAASVSGPRLHSAGPPVVPATGLRDGLSPDISYTYQILFVPDLSQKYGLRIKGGAGEIRAAMNLVNGWQFTGLGPYYMKDSSTAQNILASGITANLTGRGIADVIKSLNDLRRATGTGAPGAAHEAPLSELAQLKDRIESIQRTSELPVWNRLPDYAEIHVLEPVLQSDGTTDWREVRSFTFAREVENRRQTEFIQMKKDEKKNSEVLPQPKPGDLDKKETKRTSSGEPQAALLPAKPVVAAAPPPVQVNLVAPFGAGQPQAAGIAPPTTLHTPPLDPRDQTERDLLRAALARTLNLPAGRIQEQPNPVLPNVPGSVLAVGSLNAAPSPAADPGFLSRIMDKCCRRARTEFSGTLGAEALMQPQQQQLIPTQRVSSQGASQGGASREGSEGKAP
jgi:hypothetical protein